MLSDGHKKPAIFVEWQDAFSIDEWESVDKLATGVKNCFTVGWLVTETEKLYFVSGTISDDSDACCTIAIPKNMVSAVRQIKLTDKKQKKKLR